MKQSEMTRRAFVAAAAAGVLAADDGWIQLFNGRNMDGWQAIENPQSWKVADGLLSMDGPTSHLFYNGPVHGANFRNFELEVEAQASPACNSGIFFHTAAEKGDWLHKGFEVQIDNTSTDGERKKTGSLYGIRNIYKPLVADNEWFKLHVAVRGKNIQVRLNGTLLVDYTEPTPPVLAEGSTRARYLDHGTIALQCHDSGARARFRSVRVRPLPDALPEAGAAAPQVDDVFRHIITLGAHNYPLVDYHVHLKGGLTIDQALAQSRRDGIQYGIALNCGKGFPNADDAAIQRFIDQMKGQPVFLAMQAEGREWTQMFSRRAVAQFDYVFTDSMTWTDNRGRRMRLWMPEEVGAIPDPQEFMDLLVERAVGILDGEPIDIYVNPTFLPAVIAKDYDRLWTEKRMKRVIQAAARNHVAVEINDRYHLPSEAFLHLAKEAGCKFTFGTNNGGPNDLGRSEYGLKTIAACKLDCTDFFVPGVWCPKAVERKGGALRG